MENKIRCRIDDYLPLNYENAINLFEKKYLTAAITQCGGNISRTARAIGINKTTLLRKINYHSLKDSVPILVLINNEMKQKNMIFLGFKK